MVEIHLPLPWQSTLILAVSAETPPLHLASKSMSGRAAAERLHLKPERERAVFEAVIPSFGPNANCKRKKTSLINGMVILYHIHKWRKICGLGCVNLTRVPGQPSPCIFNIWCWIHWCRNSQSCWSRYNLPDIRSNSSVISYRNRLFWWVGRLHCVP